MRKGTVFSFIRKLAACESLWLILLKILISNRVYGRQVTALIKNENIDWGARRFRWWGTGSISQERLEEAIQLPKGTLTNAFVENIVGRRVGSRPVIRHCKACIAIGYHSSVFFVEKITHCPWHAKKIIECRNCYFELALLDNCAGRTSDFLFQYHCPHIKPMIERLPVCDLSLPIFEVIERWHDFLFGWLKAAELWCGNDVCRWIALPGYYTSRSTDYILKFLEPKIDVPTGFDVVTDYPICRLNIPHAATNWCRNEDSLLEGWQCILQEKNRCMAQRCCSKSDQIACIKSVRRYIRRRFVVKHRRCYKSFASLKMNHRMRLKYEHSCCVSVAYACWLVSIHDLYTIDAVLKNETHAYRIPRSEPIFPRPIALLAKDLNLLLAHFYEIWAGLVVSEQSNVTVIVLDSMRLHPWVSENIASIDNVVTEDECYGSSDYGIYYPALTYLSEMTEARCKCSCLETDYVSADVLADRGEYFVAGQGWLCALIDHRARKGSSKYVRI